MHLDSDRALEDEEEDKFGFAGMARRLAPSIIHASKGEGMVIGLEGSWGSGKTTLLNFIRLEIELAKDEGVHTITIAPWLNGDSSSMVASLIGPMADILKGRKNAISDQDSLEENLAKEKILEVTDLLRSYGPRTARRMASVANVAGYFVPGAQLLGHVLEAGADAAEEVLPGGITTSDLKRRIVGKIQELDIGFVVILDDLDRLEPEQAVEVVRLVRSVADFPKVTYLLCYDRDVLAQALQAGLGVVDGDLFLQKIVQLTFGIPLPEPFDLRTQFFDEARAIYADVVGEEIQGPLLENLKSAVDREGVDLSTPREVKLALNSIRFVFPQVYEDVYFPDFCRLHLIKTTNYKKYKWLERYLSVRSVVMTGDATVSKDERAQLGGELVELFPSDDARSVRSIWSLQRFIPGVIPSEKDEERVFRSISSSEVSETVGLKRLGSPFHYRFYFALTGPKTVMADADFNSLLELAKADVGQLTARFAIEVERRRNNGRTWFEHILTRLDDDCIAGLDEQQLAGLVWAFSDMMDIAIAEGGDRRPFFPSLDALGNDVAKRCLRRLGSKDPTLQAEVVKEIASKGQAVNWLVGKFFRSQLYRHGRVGDKPEAPEQWEISAEILDEAIEALKKRVRHSDTMIQIPSLPDVPSYLYGWQDLTGDNEAVDWVKDYSRSDEGLVDILSHLRGWLMSDGIYRTLSRDVVEPFLNWEEAISRLEELKGGELDAKVAALQDAIEKCRD